MSDMFWHAFEHSLQKNTGIWLKETENKKNYADKVIIRFYSITYCCFKTSPSFPKHPSKGLAKPANIACQTLLFVSVSLAMDNQRTLLLGGEQ